MGEPNNEKLVLTRIDKTKDFNPENCKWMSRSGANKLQQNMESRLESKKNISLLRRKYI